MIELNPFAWIFGRCYLCGCVTFDGGVVCSGKFAHKECAEIENKYRMDLLEGKIKILEKQKGG